jgi:hypothetical protein
MTRLRALKDAALESRLGRLRRSEVALKQQLHGQIEQAESAGRRMASDPECQRLSAVLRRVRLELREAESERARRRLTRAGIVKPAPLTRNGRTSSVLGPKQTGL